MRMLSLFGGLISISLAYHFGRAVVSSRFGLITACAVSTFSFFFYYTHEIRMYSILPGLIFLLYWTYWRIMLPQRQPHWYDWVILYTVLVIMVYTHYFVIFPLLAMGVYHLFAPKNRRWFAVIGVVLLVAVSFSVWLPVVIEGFTTRKSLDDINQNTPQLIRTLTEIYTNGILPLILVQLAGLYAIVRAKTPHRHFLLVMILAPLIAVLIINNITALLPERRMRYSIVLLPSFALMLSYALYYLYQWRKWAMLTVSIIWLGGFFSFGTSQRIGDFTARIPVDSDQFAPIHGIQRYISTVNYMPQPEQVFIMTPDVESMTSVAGNYIRRIDNPYIHLHETFIHTELNTAPIDILQDIVDFENLPAFWLGYRTGYDPQTTETYSILTQYHRSCGVRKADDMMQIEYFLKDGIPCELIDAPLGLHYEEQAIELSHLYTEQTDTTLNLFSIWKRPNINENFPYSLSFQIFNSNNEKMTQADYIAPFEPIDSKSFDISELPTGNYTLTVTLYDFATGTVNPAIDTVTNEPKRTITVASFDIAP